ncbi:MAG: class I SAM-dependent methyltransferase [Gammaproteobacteria bacterium]|nr:class I SAM-dependent methyltransferase [Gammaproteobacteria bacterium]
MADLFSEKAKEWDINEMVLALSTGIGSAINDNIVFNKSMHVMDFGAGTGLITSKVASQVDKITAVDVSQSMLDQLVAKEELKGKVDAVCQDITTSSLDKEFDLIVSAMAMHHVEDTDKMLQCFADHLKSGAKVALADLDKEDGTFHPEDIEGVYHSGFERDFLQKKMENSGFTDIKFVTAHTVDKGEKSYPIFLVTASKA